MTNYCRFCNEPLKHVFLDLGKSPLANSFLKKEMLNKSERFFPLCVYVCDKCFLVQLPEYENPKNIFGNYAYFSSYSDTWLKHAENYVNSMINRFSFDKNNLVIEIASNDGYLLQYFKKKGIPVLGIEPAANVAQVAIQKGIPTLVKFFGTNTAKELVRQGNSADLIVGNNVLAHIPNINDFVEGLKILLKPDGIITMEFPHLLKLIKGIQFDTIYHEHFSYFSLIVVQKIFFSHGLTIFDVDELETHGGSLRIYAKHTQNNVLQTNENIDKMINQEIQFGLEDISSYTTFSIKVKILRERLREFFITAKKENKKIVCYGAAAKGNTLLNYCEIGKDFVEYVIDRNTFKQGLYLPGTHIPIKNPEKVRKTKPDYVVILPWNIKDEIMQQMNYIRDWGGNFVILLPEVDIIP
jgi:2-polyprenyl-3-methyl-5-hydroxy-6-metoxy-1,4-benzoquinol methylase